MSKTEKTLGTVAGAALFGTMLLTLADVIGRKFFQSIPGAVELTELMLLLLIFLALPLATARGEHVTFDLVDHVLPRRVRHWQRLVGHVLCAAIVGTAAWLVFERAVRTAEQGDITPVLHLPVAPLYYAAALFLLFDAITHLVLLIRASAPGARDA